MNIEQKVFKFTECWTSKDCKDIYVSEEFLDEKHINLLAGELTKQYQNLPERSKIIFREALDKQIKQIEC